MNANKIDNKSKPEQTKEFLCRLCSKVNDDVFHFQVSADCFCGEKETTNFQFDKDILNFIDEAVNEKIEREKTI